MSAPPAADRGRGDDLAGASPASIPPARTGCDLPADLDQMCDRALATGRPVVVGAVVVIPDTAELQGLANGLPPLPPAAVRRRADGRSVKLFRAPVGQSWPLGGGTDG